MTRLGGWWILVAGCATVSGGGAGGSTPLPPSPYLVGPVSECEEAALVDPGPPAVAGDECLWRGGHRPETLAEIRCPSDFEVLAAGLPSAVFADTRSLKFVIDMQDHDRLYFVNSYLWELHFTFARDRLDGAGHTAVGTHAEFNRREYESSAERRFLLGNVVHFREQDTWTLEFAAGDVATPEQVARAYHRVRRAMAWPTDVLRYRAVSAEQLDRPAHLPADIPVITTDALFAHVHYQPVRAGTAVGRLVKVPYEELADADLGPHDILMTDRVPLDLPPVAGVITGALQTPLAHVAVLAHSRGIPDMALVGAFDDPTLAPLVGHWVKLRVTHQAFTVEPSEPRAARPAGRHIEIALDLGPMDLVPLERVTVDDIPSVGAKAAHLGTAAGIGPEVPVPPGFVIPVARYVQFMQQNGLAARAAAIAADPAIVGDRARLKQALEDLRDAIRQAPVDAALVRSIAASMRRIAGDHPVRFRSSTNAEDLAGFSGAGLYTSKTVDLSDPGRSIERGLRAVWASVYNLKAFEEREIFGIPHDRVAMAILVHRAFPEEAANGVAITRNLFTRFRPAYTINVQAGESSVTNPDGESTPEQYLYYTFYNEGPRVEYLARSSLTHGAPVLSQAEMDTLARALTAIHQRFSRWYGTRPDFAMDVEFKFDGPERSLYIKQARPFVSGGCSL